MDYKKAKMLAFIGSLMMLTSSFLLMLPGIGNWKTKLFDLIPYSLLSLLHFIGFALIAIFFYFLYKKED